MSRTKVNDVEGWVGYRHRFFGIPQKRYLKLSGSTITIHPTPTGVIESYISTLESKVVVSLLGRVITLQMQSGYKYFLHFENRFQCQEWATVLKNSSTKKFHMYYELGEQIGEGSFASVYRATRKSDGTVVAVKKVVKQQFDMVTYRELQREIYTMNNITHSGVVKTYDVFNYPTEAYFVLEFMQGGSLKDIVRKAGGRVSEASALQITKQVLLALVYLHENGYAHRDIKLENILCESEDLESTRVCLADFGYTTFFAEPGDESMRSLIGTPVYVAPEIFRERPYSEAVDLYAVGVMIFRMLCGEYPYDGGVDNDKTKDLTIAGKLVFRQKAWKVISIEAMSLVRSLLQQNPRKRLTALGALQHSWFTNRKLRSKVNDSTSKLLLGRVQGKPGNLCIDESATTISKVAPIKSSDDGLNEPRSPRFQELLAQFSSVDNVHPDALPKGAHDMGEKASSACSNKGVMDPRLATDDGLDVRHSSAKPLLGMIEIDGVDTSVRCRPKYTSEELRKKLKRCILVAVCFSKLLLVSEIRRPKRRKQNYAVTEGSKLPDRRKEDRHETVRRTHRRASSRSVSYRTFSFSGRFAGNGSPVARLTSRLRRTFSLTGRSRR